MQREESLIKAQEKFGFVYVRAPNTAPVDTFRKNNAGSDQSKSMSALYQASLPNISWWAPAAGILRMLLNPKGTYRLKEARLPYSTPLCVHQHLIPSGGLCFVCFYHTEEQNSAFMYRKN